MKASRNAKSSWWQKIAAFILGIFLVFVLMEAGLRFGGFIVSSLQEYRNRAVAGEKGAYLIMCLGESTTSDGPGPYPEQLENILNQHNIGVKFAVVNKGVPTVNTKYILGHLSENLKKYRPKMVVVMMGINDGYIKYYEGMQDANDLLFNKLRTYRFARLIQKNIFEKARIRKLNALAVNNFEPEKDFAVELGSNWEDIVQGWFSKEKRKNLELENSCKNRIKSDPGNTKLYVELGWLYMRERKYFQAKKIFLHAANLNAGDSSVYFGIGVLYQTSGQYFQAKEAFEKAVSLDPGHDAARVALGWIYMHTNDYAKAEEIFQEGIAFHPKRDKMYRALIELYRQIGDNRSADECSMLRSEFGLEDDSCTNITRLNYLKLKEVIDRWHIRLICVQYPVRSVSPLKKIFEAQPGVLFVDNEDTFKNAIKLSHYDEYFIDMFAGDFGHCTKKGNKLLAEDVASVILKEVFNK